MEKLKIYHFANGGYGRPFLENYGTFPSVLKEALDIIVVFSLNREKPFSFWQLLKHKLYRWRIYQNYRNEFYQAPFKILLVENVKALSFLNSIPKGSIGLCSGFNQIFSPELIARFDEFINVHPSVLPYYRGPVPSYWCLKNREKQSGYTIHRVTSQIDKGEILYQGVVPILATDTEYTLDQKIAMAAKEKVMDWLDYKVSTKKYPVKRLDANEVYYHKINYRSFPSSYKCRFKKIVDI